mgnify:CR=1 FL=1
MKLEIQNLSAGYDNDVILKDLSLSMKEEEFLSLLGPSGCGKTTLMKSIAGILQPGSGKIFLDGQDITALPIHKRGTTVVFQDMRLFPHKSVAENVAFPLKMQGIPKAERIARAEALLEKVQLPGYGSRRPSELSGGQQQRVALARALAAQPKLLLLDEPFSALDENLREDMRSLVLQLKDEFKMTVILVTHDREEALSMSDRIALMFGGKLIQTGTPKEVYNRPASRQAADYFGNCVYIRGKAEQGMFKAPGICCPTAVPDGDYTIMLRPDALDTEMAGDYAVTVENVSFRGSDTQVTFRSEDGTCWKKAYTGVTAWTEGTVVSAKLTVQQPILFAD